MSLIKNSIWNLIGTVASAVVMIPAMGFFARQLDTESFGLLTLVLAFVGYASVLDGGFARAVIREVARSGDDRLTIRRIMSSAIWVVMFLGLFFGCLVWVASPWLVQWIKVDELSSSAIAGFKWASFIVLPVLLGMLGMAPLEGLAQFVKLNIVRSVGYAIVFASAILAVLVDNTFTSAVIGLLIGRVLMAAVCWWVSRSYISSGLPRFDLAIFSQLYRFGGWVTVSNLISPMMDYLDRFVLSAVSGAQSVAFYAAPAEGVQKLQTLPGSVARALFPMLSDKVGLVALKLALKAVGLQAVVGLGIAVVLVLFGDALMGIWLGPEFAIKSGEVIRILGFGVLFNSVAMIPQTALQALGKAKATAAVHLTEVIPFVGLLYWLTDSYGIEGTALAWVVRTFVDLCLMGWIYYRQIMKNETVS